MRISRIRSLRASSVAAQLLQRAHGVAAGALLDDDRGHQHRHLARGQPLLQALERAVQRLAEPHLLDHARPSRRRPGRRARAPPSAPRPAIESPAWVPLESIRARSGSWSMNASRRLVARALDVPAQAADDDRVADDERRTSGGSSASSSEAEQQPADHHDRDRVDRRQRPARGAQPLRRAARRWRVRRSVWSRRSSSAR